ncbi:MAG TPA: helix-turn-helix domain-containing protein, partial [Candidatus Kapabacteria bacterium]|nr:helix-turn-helix domain-containing protein [Candidatus Kapabacteria bacterium]
FRLNAVQIELPPLREHVQDIPLLVEYFAERVAEKYKFKFEGISYEAITILKSLPWPGNIRQLKNLIETIVTLEKGAFISREILLKYIPPALPEHKRSEIPKTNSIVAVSKELPDNETSILLKSILEIKSDIADIKHFLGRIASNFDLLFEDIHSLKQSINGQNENPQTEIPIKPLELVEKEMIIAALSKFSNNRRMAARALGISERTLYRKLIEYGIK